MSVKPICFDCKHFKQYQPLHFMTPGECGWEPAGSVPEWLQLWLDMNCRYYGPNREVSTSHPIFSCEAFTEKTDDEPKRA